MSIERLSDFRAGTTKRIKIDYGSGVDITGWEFELRLMSKLGQGFYDLQVSCTAGDDAADDVSNGLAFLTVTSNDSDIVPGKYYYVLVRIISGLPDDVKAILPAPEDYREQIEILPGV